MAESKAVLSELACLKSRLERLELRVRAQGAGSRPTFNELRGWLKAQGTTKEEIDEALYRVPEDLLG